MKEKIKRWWKYLLIISIVVLGAIGIGIYILVNTEYTYVKIVENYERQNTTNCDYVTYADGVLEYSKDGIALLTEEGEELWNQPCQMGNPIVEVCEEAAVVADNGGTNIYVFEKKGLKGEIKTTRPIEKIAVSAQGIVATVLKDEKTPRVMCYDAKGNVLVEHKASMSNTGYPIDIALSPNGKGLMVSYLCAKGNDVSTKISFYYFGKEGKSKKDYQVMQKEYLDTVAPTVAFLNEETALAITDHSLIFYDGLKEPKEVRTIGVDKEIRSISYNEKNVAMILKNSEGEGYELRVYRIGGKIEVQESLDKEYKNIKLLKKRIILENGNACAIYSFSGVCKFKGTLEMNVIGVYPTKGMNKYIVISANGFQKVQLAK